MQRIIVHIFIQSKNQVRTLIDDKYIFCPAKNARNHRAKTSLGPTVFLKLGS